MFRRARVPLALLLGFSIMFIAVVFRFRKLVTGELASEVDRIAKVTEFNGLAGGKKYKPCK